MKKEKGILLPIFSLPNKYGIGAFSKEAYEFIDFISEANQNYWQILPLNPTSYGDSPYQSPSAYAGNPYFIDIEKLYEEKLISRIDLELAKRDWGKIDYSDLFYERNKLLKKAYLAFNEKEKPNDYNDFITKNNFLSKYLQIHFIPNYNVSAAEILIAGTDVSLQVSTAGMEASGTGNMKFMQNGAVTVGTLDGANVEINSLAGEGNNYIFGAEESEVVAARSYYNPKEIIKNDPKIKRVVDTLIDNTFDDRGTNHFRDIYDSLVNSDYYFVLYDLKEFIRSVLKVNEDYLDKKLFHLKVLANISNSGYFSSDRSIKEYAKLIWNIK